VDIDESELWLFSLDERNRFAFIACQAYNPVTAGLDLMFKLQGQEHFVFDNQGSQISALPNLLPAALHELPCGDRKPLARWLPLAA